MPDNQPVNPSADQSVDQSAEQKNQTPAQRLEQLQAQLKIDDDKVGALTKERDALKADVDSLAKTVDEINKAKAAYEKAFASLNEDKNKLEVYQAKVAAGLDGTLGANKPKVVAAIEAVKQKITDKEGDIKTAKTNADTAAKEAADAQAILDTRQQAYDDYKNLQKKLGDNIQKMQAFQTTIGKFDDAKPASMYVFLQELKAVLDVTKVPDQATFEAELSKRWKQLDDAKEVARAKKLAAEAAKAKLTSEEAALASLVKSRVDDLLKATEQFN